MRTALLTAFLLAATPALAQTAPAAAAAPAVRSGQVLRDVANLRIGAIDSVKPDGSVGVIVDGRYVIIPASTLSMADGKLMTSLSKKAVLSAN